MLLTPSSRRKHLLMLQHQQRSSMDTDALDEEIQVDQTQVSNKLHDSLFIDRSQHTVVLTTCAETQNTKTTAPGRFI